MAQFTAYANSNPVTHEQYPYLLDIQSELLSELKTTVVIPLSPADLVGTISLSRLNPALTLNGEQLIAMTQDLAGIDRRQLGAVADDLSTYRSEIIAALDFVISGI
ncbi:CcdB family protein [Rheinheimera pleomorphica]|uniref:CcdB family protein n=1 Tax=Rheinheimera pleomorphica TaxID=2703963 RepID=UPI0014223AEC|nr:CcdB family protein [Rheinheimera pleomorphica]